MTRMQGPFNLNINEEIGVLVAGSTPRPCADGARQPYVGPADRGAGGLQKAKDVYAYLYDMRVELPRERSAGSSRGQCRGAKVRQLDMKKLSRTRSKRHRNLQ